MRRAGRRMSKMQPRQADDQTQIKHIFSRRDFVRSGAMVVGSFAVSNEVFAAASGRPAGDEGSAIRLGVATYTFRNFTCAQMIGFLKQLNVLELNVKDTKDHLPMEAQAEAAALADYAAAGGKLHAAGTHSFPKDEGAAMREQR